MLSLHKKRVLFFAAFIATIALNAAGGLACEQGTSVAADFTFEEFATSYQQVFSMSDGSFVDPQQNEHMRGAFERMLLNMQSVGVQHDTNLATGYNVTICESDLPKILMFAVLGNFVSKPEIAHELMQLSYKGTLATVVVDRSGTLVVVETFDNMRKYYLEALLLLSVLAIARLSAVKKEVESAKEPGLAKGMSHIKIRF